MRTRIIIFVIVVNAILWGALAYVFVGTVQAQSSCPAIYIVQRGDWLAAIARRHNTTVNELLRLNPHLHARMDLIFPGETLCVPVQPSPPTPTPPTEPTGFLGLEAEFTVQPVAPMTVTLPVSMSILGKRKPLALQANDGITGTTLTGILDLATPQNSPVLIAFGNAEDARNISPDFTLLEVGSSDILSSLRLDQTKPFTLTSGCDGRPLNEAFGMAASESMTLVAWLEGKGGGRIPFPITKVGVVPAADISGCWGTNGRPLTPAFVVLPANPPQPDLYRVFVRVKGPLGSGDPVRYVCQALGQLGRIICGGD